MPKKRQEGRVTTDKVWENLKLSQYWILAKMSRSLVIFCIHNLTPRIRGPEGPQRGDT